MFESHVSIIVELIISFILCLLILFYYARKKMNIIIFLTSLICWFLNLFLIILIPYDIYYSQSDEPAPETSKNLIKVGYQVTYWILFILSWFVIPIMQVYESCGEFRPLEKLTKSLKSNLKFFIIVGVLGLFAIIYCLIIYGYEMTFLLVKNFALIYGILFFFFLLSYGIIKYPKTLYLKYRYEKQIKYLEWKADSFIAKLDSLIKDIINHYARLKATKESYGEEANKNKDKNNKEENKIDSSNHLENGGDEADLKKYKRPKRVGDYLPEIEQKIVEFRQIAGEMGIDITKDYFDNQPPIDEYSELVEINKKINEKQKDDLRIKSRLRNCYMRWARLNTVKYYTNGNINNENNNVHNDYNKLEDKNTEENIDTSDNNNIEEKKEKKVNIDEEKTLVQEGFIPLENFTSFKLLYHSAIKKYFYLVLLILSIILGIIIVLWEFCIVCGFTFITVYRNIRNIVAIHIMTLIPLIYLISMSNYTLFKIKISSYLFMYGPRQTDSVSLITFTSYLSRIYFAICLNHIQAVNQFSTNATRTEFETFFGLDNYNLILSLCRYAPIMLYVFMILFYFNIPGKIGYCCGYNLFEFESKKRDMGIEKGHEYLMDLNKKLNGKRLDYNDNKIFECFQKNE